MRPPRSWTTGAGLAAAVLALTVLAQQMDVTLDGDASSGGASPEVGSVVVFPHEPAFGAPAR